MIEFLKLVLDAFSLPINLLNKNSILNHDFI